MIDHGYECRFSLAVNNFRNRVANFSDDALYGVEGSQVCTQVANDYDVDNDDLYAIMMADFGECE